jgi:Xaa-Pro aminopeptidase
MAQMTPGAVALVPTAPEVRRNSDCDYPFRHDSYFYYLTGFAEPCSVLVLVAASAASPARSMLFCRARNPEREIWDGHRHGPEGARASFGFDDAYAIDELDAHVTALLAHAPALYTLMGASSEFDAQVKTWLHGSTAVACDLRGALDEMRVFKDDAEQALMRRAAGISSEAHARAMRQTRPGMREYEIEAELLHEFRKNGAQYPAYPAIVAAGANACVLHYSANDALANDGDLVLIDAGCELDGYASDITRTYPVNGRFSAPQKTLYELVLAAQQAALRAVKPGQPYAAVHEAAVRVLAQGMLDLGLLDRNLCGSLEDVISDHSYRQFYMHGSGHWLGMDVHDVGLYRTSAEPGAASRQLQPGMMLTVEPGIYVRPAKGVPERFWHIGIRIEDDVQVSADGHLIISDTAPKSVRAIEEWMRT